MAPTVTHMETICSWPRPMNLLIRLLVPCFLLVPLSWGCETGVAHEGSALSVPRSLMANADVAYLQSFNATSVKQCMQDCCTGKYGHCTVASFNKNTTKKNCMHFYCEPLQKCKFLPSKSSDSFSFSSVKISKPAGTSPPPQNNLSTSTTTPGTPSTEPQKISTPQQISSTKEEIATFSEEQFAFKNDNTSIKPRKGVGEAIPDMTPSKGSVKPRKGVTLEDVPLSKYLQKGLGNSNIKPRKGVESFSSTIAPTSSSGVAHLSTSLYHSDSKNLTSEDVILALQKVFEDDSSTNNNSAAKSSSASIDSLIAPTPTIVIASSTTVGDIHTTKSHFTSHIVDINTVLSSSINVLVSPRASITPTLVETSTLNKSIGKFTTSTVVSSSTTYFLTLLKTDQPQEVVGPQWTHVTDSSDMDQPHESLLDEVDLLEEENEKKYKSSIHLVLSLVFGLLVLCIVLGVVAKRIYDGWLRRDYYRMNYLIDGIYNGVE